jgi:hypothetical protein
MVMGSLFQGEFDFELFFTLSLVLSLFLPFVGFTAFPFSK